MTTPHQLLARRTATSPAAPFVTWYGPDGRVELSAATFNNAVAKLAGLLDSEVGVAPGETVQLDLPLHWQLSVWLAACDALGLDVSAAEASDVAVVATMNPACDLPGQKVLVPATPLGLPGPPPPVGVIDQAREALGQPDIFPPTGQSGRVWSGQTWVSADEASQSCQAMADQVGLTPGGRLAITGDPADRLIGCYLLPLTFAASVVLRQDLDASIATEAVTATW